MPLGFNGNARRGPRFRPASTYAAVPRGFHPWPFPQEEIERYARHIVLADVGGPGQQKLKAARVLVVGAGGLGAPVIQYLAAAGVGTLGIVDDDAVSLSNLQRQVIHDTAAVGAPRSRARATRSRGSIRMSWSRRTPLRLTADNAAALVGGYDVVADCSDNFATRYAVSDACFHARKPLITAAVGQFDGSLTTLKPVSRRRGRRAQPDLPLPLSRARRRKACCRPAPRPESSARSTGVIGSMQALEVIKEIVGIGERSGRPAAAL